MFSSTARVFTTPTMRRTTRQPLSPFNAHAVRAMAKACARQKARFVHISTDYVFGGDARQREPLRETSPTAPVNVYGASKALGETLAFAELERVLVLRVASLFGVHGARAKGGNFVETMIRLGRDRRALRVVNDQIMSPTATRDVARIVLRAVSTDHTGVFHVVNSGVASWFDFAKQIVYKAGVDAEVTPCASSDSPRRALRPRYSALDNAKAASAFGPLPPWAGCSGSVLERQRTHPICRFDLDPLLPPVSGEDVRRASLGADPASVQPNRPVANTLHHVHVV